MPELILVAGPNGSGKSTIAASIATASSFEIVDPDAIARRIDPLLPAKAAIPAARLAISRCRTLIAERQNFILESTLAGHGALGVVRKAMAARYQTLLVYVALSSVDLQIERVRLRVAQGGHDIPEVDIRRRYSRSLTRAPHVMCVSDEVLVLDNSGSQPVPVSTLKNGRLQWKAELIPLWASELIKRFDTA